MRATRSTSRGARCDPAAHREGRAPVDRLGTFLAGVGFVPDAPIFVAEGPRLPLPPSWSRCTSGSPVGIDPRLGDALEPEDLDAILTEAGDPVRPVLVGHDRDFSELAALPRGASHLPMRKGAMLRIDIDRPLRAGVGTLRWLLPPDLL